MEKQKLTPAEQKPKRALADDSGSCQTPKKQKIAENQQKAAEKPGTATHLERYAWSPTCEATLDTLKPTLERYGVAILPRVLNENECRNMRNGMWDFLEHATQKFDTPIRRTDVESRKQLKHLFPKHSMLIQHFGIGHAQFVWDQRQNPKVIAPFLKLYDVKQPADLLTSFDGASIHFPPEEFKNSRSGWFRNHWWFHTDQAPARNGFECVQSWVTANDVRPGDGTLAILEGGHLLHGEFAKEFQLSGEKKDWFKFEPKHLDWFAQTKGCAVRCIQCPAGSMVFWDSRTPHCGIEASPERKEPNTRCVAYVCMTPRKWCSATNLTKRIKAFKELRMTTHWPHKPKLFGKTPQTYGQKLLDIAPVKPPTLTDLGRALVGYEPVTLCSSSKK